MGKTILIRFDENDLGQLIDGLTVRADCWRGTQRYLETGKVPGPDFICEECRDANEARKIADQYDRIIENIVAQRGAHRKADRHS